MHNTSKRLLLVRTLRTLAALAAVAAFSLPFSSVAQAQQAVAGKHFAYLPCLNASPGGVTMLRHLLARELAGWIEAA